jgi:hypothetical protein
MPEIVSGIYMNLRGLRDDRPKGEASTFGLPYPDWVWVREKFSLIIEGGNDYQGVLF